MGTVWSLGLLGFALLRRNEPIKRVALACLVVTALTAVPAYVSGEPAEEIAGALPGFSDAILERHEEAASVALGSTLVLGLLALVAGRLAGRLIKLGGR